MGKSTARGTASLLLSFFPLLDAMNVYIVNFFPCPLTEVKRMASLLSAHMKTGGCIIQAQGGEVELEGKLGAVCVELKCTQGRFLSP